MATSCTLPAALVLALLVAAAAPARAEEGRPATASPLAGARTAGAELRVLTYNTHGLPSWVAGDVPERRFPRIGALLNDYDLVLLQEDFFHHERMRPTLLHPVVVRGNPSRFESSLVCLVFCNGSGLTFLTTEPPERLLRLDNVAYGECAGWLSGANDCFATKGFQHARLELAPGLRVDVVNTHLDAGRDPEDRAARRAQLRELREHLLREADGAALIVGGDLNLRGGDARDETDRDSFARALGLTDSGARFSPGGPWTRLDYLYYRSGAAARLEVLEAGEAGEFVDADAPLSDHPALFARFRVEAQVSAAMPPSTGITAPER